MMTARTFLLGGYCQSLLFAAATTLIIVTISTSSAVPSTLAWIPPILHSNTAITRSRLLLRSSSYPPSSSFSSVLLPPPLQASKVDSEEGGAIFTSTVNSNSSSKSGDETLLRIGKRVGSGAYGTVHIAYIDNEEVVIAKRPWTLAELELNVPLAVTQLDNNNYGDVTNERRTGLARSESTGLVKEKDNTDDDMTNNKNDNKNSLKERAERCQYYWNVERHIFQKLSSYQARTGGKVLKNVTPKFRGVFRGNSQLEGADKMIVPGYGKIGTQDKNNNNRNKLGGFSFLNNGNDGDESDEGSGQHEWMVFEYITSSSFKNVKSSSSDDNEHDNSTPAMTLLDAMEMDWKEQRRQKQQHGENHRLEGIGKALNLKSNKFGDTLDAVFLSILEDLKVIHECNIVHRDVKPGNLLCDSESNRLLLIDFGSAADFDLSPPPPPAAKNNGLGNIFSYAAAGLQQQQNRRVGFDEGLVAISPIYSAPEIFVKLNENPLSFDVFSAALIMCQLLFNLLDERTDAGFNQQLREANYDLDAWLENSLRAKLRPLGFDDALEYLSERRGLWGLLKNMFQRDPLTRISSSMALERLLETLALRSGEIGWSEVTIARVAREESYFETVIDSFDKCTVSYGDVQVQDDPRPRPLHFLASFKVGFPAGLVLAEASDGDIDDDDDMSDEAKGKWKEATKFAFPGEVFVKGWNTNGQADKLGIFEVGDRLRGVGELPFTNGGFIAAVDLIERQPRTGGTLKLHFDRLSASMKDVTDQIAGNRSACKKVVSQGVWKSKGRRGNQEDSFVLHEIKNDVSGDVLLAGVFDGHAGTAASESVSKILPTLFNEELTSIGEAKAIIRDALERSWERTCNLYRNGCEENGECVVDYDPVEGILYAETGSADLVAGTTATVAAVSMNPSGTNELTILNCGDSKTMLIGEPVVGDGSVVVFETRDHSPDDKLEIKRLARGKELGLDYSIPECSMSGSYLRVGDFQYALCRSLEGTFVTSKGIVSDPDITQVNLASALVGRQHNSLVLACDGLLEVMSSEEVGREVVLMRKARYTAGETAKNLCGQALKKGSHDNISVIVVHLDDV